MSVSKPEPLMTSVVALAARAAVLAVTESVTASTTVATWVL